jgi:hypothetical protein
MSSSVLPPAGWYDDPDRAGQHRFWDGSSWTEDRRVPAAPPPPTGPPLPAVPAPVATVPVAAAPARIVCPVCGQSDMLRNVGALFDEGTATTHGTAHTVTSGYGSVSGMGSDGTIYSGSARTTSVGTTTHHAVTRTQLAGRFLAPSRPKSDAVAWFFLGWLGTALLIAVLWGPALAPSSADLGPVVMTIITIGVTFVVVLAGTWVVGIVVAVIRRAATRARVAQRQAAWDDGYRRLRSAAFCARDGVAVENGRAYSPEGLRDALFGA